MVNEELIAQLTGDATKYVQMLDDAIRKTNVAGEHISKAMDGASSKASHALDKIGTAASKQSEVLGKAASATSKATDETNKTADAVEKAATNADHMSSVVKTNTAHLQEWANKAKRVGSNLNELGQNLSNLANQFSGFKREVGETFTLFGIQEKAERGLAAALQGNQRISSKSIQTFSDYASSLQDVTTYGDEATLQLLSQAVAYGLNEHQAKKAVKQAIALAEATNRSARETISATSKLQEGSAEGLGEYIPTLSKIKDNTEKVTYAHQRLNEMFSVAEAKARTASGSLAKLTNAWGDFKEKIGETIAEISGPVLRKLSLIVDQLNKLPTWVKYVIGAVLSLVAVFASLIAIGGAAATTIGVLIIALSALKLAFGQAAIAAITLNLALTKTFAGVFLVTMAKTIAIAGFIALAIYGIKRGLEALMGVDNSEIDNTITKSQELTDQWASRFKASSVKILKAFDDIYSKSERKVKIGLELEKQQKELAGLTNAIKGAKKEVDDIDTRWNRWTASKAIDIAKSHLKDLQIRADEVGGFVGELQKKLDDIKPPTQELKEFNLEMRKQIDTINMSQDQIRLYEFSLEDISRATLDATRRTIEFKAAMERIGGVSAEIKNTVENFERMRIELNPLNRELSNTQKHMIQMGAALDREFEKRKNIGIEQTTKDIEAFNEQMRLLHTHLDSLNKGVPSTLFKTDVEETKKSIIEYSKRVEELKTQLKEARDFQLELLRSGHRLSDLMKSQDQIRILERTNKLLDRGAELTNQYRTPLREFQDTIKELKILSEAGVLNEGTFTRALDDATKKFIQLDNAARGAREEMMVFDSVEFKSTEAQRRIAEFVNESRRQLDEQRRMMEARRKALNEPIKVDPKNIEVERKAMEEARKFAEQRNKLKAGFQEIPTPNIDKADYLPVIKAFTDFIKKVEREILDIIPRRIYDTAPMPRERHPAPMPRRVFDQLDMMPRRIFDKAPMPHIPGQWPGPLRIFPNPLGINPGVDMSARADATLEADTKEMVKLLKSVDSTLLTISKKEAPVIGVATMRT